MKRYNPSEIEPKWQQIWRDDARYHAADTTEKPKYYVTGMFPYPSGAGMHAGHFFEHSIVDAEARFRRALGYNVVYPMGWDAFGLPAENYAIKTGVSPQKATHDNIANFKNQLNRVGASIDWSREINTSDPEYYRWTQWVFTKLFERGLAYQKESLQWWCPIDQTVLANEQVINGKCWRHDGPDDPPAEKKSIKQWFFKITDYADQLLEDIPALDWPDKIKTAQTNWIGRSEGAEIRFKVITNTANLAASSPEGSAFPAEAETRTVVTSGSAVPGGDDGGEVSGDITVFSTRPDTIFGATFLVLAPEHSLARQLATEETRKTVNAYIDAAIKKSEIDRTNDTKEKTGVFTGSYATNPASGEKVPIWIADYVLGGYGTGAVMGVPAHDQRDFEFAEKFELPIIQVVSEYRENTRQFTPRDDVDTVRRRVADAIITDGRGNYLLETSTEGGITDTHFVGGGIEDFDDSAEAGIRREVVEETGYTDISSVRQVAPINSGLAYRPKRAINHLHVGGAFEVTLASRAQIESEIDEGKHIVTWVPKSDVEKLLTWDNHKAFWQQYLSDDYRKTFVNEGLLVNSGPFDGISTSDAREEIVAWLEQQGVGEAKTTYKMRDWLISRQRYWGAPIPIIHCPEHGAVAVPEKDLPVLLPEVKDYAPKGDGKSPLARQTDWVKTVCPKCGQPATRETDVMDGYACSSWYLLRYTDPHNDAQAWAPEKAGYWSPVDMYVGGDHAVAHLLYVRFWSHVFYEMGLVPTREPVTKLVYHGLIQAEDGTKMSKSKGNVVDPLDVIDDGYGADALRTFELFLGPVNENSSWSSHGIAGVYRFLNRAWTLTQEYMDTFGFAAPTDFPKTASRPTALEHPSGPDGAVDVLEKPSTREASPHTVISQVATKEVASGGSSDLERLTHQTIKKVTDDIHRLSFNTAIAALMEYVNELYKLKTAGFSDDWHFAIESLVQLLQPFAPHMAAELWQQLGHADQLDFVTWPTWDDGKLVSDEMTVVVQVNGKLRAKLVVASNSAADQIKQQALADEGVRKYLTAEPKKVIYVPGKLVSIVV